MRKITKFLAIAPVALIVGMAACDNAQNVTAPQQKVSAQFSSSTGPRRVVATVSAAHNSAVIDAHGGSIQVENANHQVIALLSIPGGAVANSTTFTIDISSDYVVSLTATSANGAANDVGAAGFKKNLQLYFNTAFILRSPLGRLGVAQLLPNGSLAPVVSSVSGSWLVGSLAHFSDYVPDEECCYAPIEDSIPDTGTNTL